MHEPQPLAPRPAAEDFATHALDWPAVRADYERHVKSSLGRRALHELVPRSEEGARAAMARLEELGLVAGRGELPPFAGVSDPLPLFRAVHEHRRPFEPEELATLADYLRAAGLLGRWIEERAEVLPACHELFAEAPGLLALHERIAEVVDPRGKVRDDASPRLLRLRNTIQELSRTVDKIVRKIAGSGELRRFLADGQQGQVHRRAGRPVLAVKARHLGQVPGIVHDRSQSEETLFVEPQAAVEPNNQLMGAKADEAREIAVLLAELTRQVLADEEAVLGSAVLVGELELALIGADWARERGGRAPLLPGAAGAADELLLRSFRHPLLLAQEAEGRLQEVVPLDLRLGADFDMLVLTGPNTGGKTLALKSAGLAALLARLGLPLACEAGTTVPLYAGVVADIGDEQEIEQSLSTFSSHLARIRAGLERADAHTLVLLDELGGGTDPDEGAALGDSILERLLELRAPTLASTHLGVLKEFAFRHVRAENACVEFDLESLAPLYRLVVGSPGESRALAIARRLGLDTALVDRAETRLRRPEAEMQSLMEDVRNSRVAAEGVREAAENRLQELEQERDALREEQDELRQRRAALGEEVEQDLEARLRASRSELERMRTLLPQLSAGVRTQMEGLLEGLATHLGGESLGDRRSAFFDGLHKGDTVYLPRFKKRASVLKLDKKRQRATVRMGRQTLELKFEELSAFESL